MNEPAPTPRLVLPIIIAFTAFSSLAATATLDTFDGGGTPCTLVQSAGAPGPAIGTLGPSGNFLRLTSSNASQSNLAVYDQTITAASDTVTAEFDFRIGGGSRADGLGFALLNVNNYGSTGSCPFVGADEINAIASLGIGFDVYKNTNNPNDPGNNHISLHYDNNWIAAQDLNGFGYSLYRPSFAVGDAFDHAKIIANLSAGTVTVIITPAGKAAFTVFNNYPIPGMEPYLWRAYIAGRTGGQTVTVDVDNINVSAAGIEPVAPVAAPDNYATLPGQPLTVAAPGVLSNDYDLNGDVLTAALDTDVTSGALTLNANGSFTYTPSNGFTGMDSFTYHANDGAGYDSAVVVVSINVFDIPPGLAVWYKFDEGAGTTAADSSGNNYNGTLTNGPVWTDGVHGNALSFDGADDSVENLMFNVPANCAITISYWNFVSTAQLQLDSAFSIGTGGSAGADRIQCHSPYSDRKLYWDSGNDSTGRLSADYASYLDKWTHVSLVSTGSTGAYRAVYLDGVLAASKSSSAGASAKTGLYVGYFSQPGAAWHHKGKIDDFRIYNRVLSDAEIAQLSQLPPSAIPDTFTAYANEPMNVPAPGLLANDTDPNADFLTAILDTNIAHGTLVLNADGSFTYTPENGFLGTDSFTYHANDGKGNDSAPAQVTINVVKATPTITWSNPAAIPYGSALSSTQLTATAAIPGTFAYNPPSGTILAAGIKTLTVTFTPDDHAYYNVAIKSVTILVNKATLTATAENKSKAFGSINPPLTATFSGFVNNDTEAVLSGAPNLATTAAANSAPGSYPILISQGTLSAANYTFAYINGALTVGNVPSFSNLSAPTVQYGAVATVLSGQITFGSTGSVRITLDGVAQLSTIDASGSFSPSFNTSALELGSYEIDYEYLGGDGLQPISETRRLSVVPATPQITWAAPADITYGTRLSDAQLNAISAIEGSFTYAPALDTLLNAGSHVMTASFIPVDTTHFFSTNATVTLNVQQATPEIVWDTPADLPYGFVLTDVQLNAFSDVPGIFTYNPPSGTLMDTIGSHVLGVDFAPDDSQNYVSVSASVTVNVLKAEQAITFDAIPDQEYGSLPLMLSATASSSLPVEFKLLFGPALLQDNTLVLQGTGLITVRAEQAGNDNYSAAPPVDQTFSVVVIAPRITSSLTAAGTQSQPFSHILTASGTKPLTFESGTLPAGLTLNVLTGEISGTPSQAGAFLVTVTAKNAAGAHSLILTLVFVNSGGTENHRPQISSSPSAFPNPAAINQDITFTAAGSDPDGESVSIVWEFGDGSTGYRGNATHQYTAPGVYAVKVTISDGVASDYRNLTVVANSLFIPPDEYKKFTVSKLALKFDFKSAHKDTLSIAGTVPIPAGFVPDKKAVGLRMGDLAMTFALEAKGSSSDKAFKLTGSIKNGAFSASPAKFALALKNADLFADLQSLGFENEDVKGKLVDASVVLTVDGIGYLAGLKVSYTAKENKSGAGRK